MTEHRAGVIANRFGAGAERTRPSGGDWRHIDVDLPEPIPPPLLPTKAGVVALRVVAQAVLERCPRDWAAESPFQRFVDACDVHRPFRLQQQQLNRSKERHGAERKLRAQCRTATPSEPVQEPTRSAECLQGARVGKCSHSLHSFRTCPHRDYPRCVVRTPASGDRNALEVRVPSRPCRAFGFAARGLMLEFPTHAGPIAGSKPRSRYT